MKTAIDSLLFPQWFAPLPSFEEGKVSEGGWARVTEIRKRVPDGTQFVPGYGGPKLFSFDIDSVTGDLYGQATSEGIDDKTTIAIKGFCMAFGVSIYTPLYLVSTLISSAYKIGQVAFASILQLSHLPKRGLFATSGDLLFSFLYLVPVELLEGGWRLLRAPLYGTALMAASIYTALVPLEGRKWISAIETAWHQGATYRDDARQEKEPLKALVQMLEGKKVIFLGFCMLKRGNLFLDKVGDKFRFEATLAPNKNDKPSKSEEKIMAFGLGSMFNWTSVPAGYRTGEYTTLRKEGETYLRPTDLGKGLPPERALEAIETGDLFSNTRSASTALRVFARAVSAIPEAAFSMTGAALNIVYGLGEGTAQSVSARPSFSHFSRVGQGVAGLVKEPVRAATRLAALLLVPIDPQQARRLQAYSDGGAIAREAPLMSRLFGTAIIGNTKREVTTPGGTFALSSRVSD